MTSDEIAVKAIRDAAAKVQDLLHGVDEGKIPLRKHLAVLIRCLMLDAQDLEDRCKRESVG